MGDEERSNILTSQARGKIRLWHYSTIEKQKVVGRHLTPGIKLC